MNEDPFDLVKDRLVVAAGGPSKAGRRGGLILLVAVLVLSVAAAATAAVTLTDSEPSKPMTGVLPSPSPTFPPGTPTPTPPSVAPQPNQPPRNIQPPRGRNRTPGIAPGVTPTPTPAGPTNYTVELMPDLTAGSAGWCVGVAVRGSGFRAGGRGCGPAGPPGTHLIAGGGLIGPQGLMYTVVDRSVASINLSNGRRIIPKRDPGVPAGWRVAVWDVNVLPGGQPPDFMLNDAAGRELTARPSTAGRGELPTRKVNAKRPPKARCAIRAKTGSGLRAVSARLLTKFETLDVVRPSYLACSTTVFYAGNRRYRAAVLLNARDLKATAPPLPSAPNSISARRVGPGWLVVFGGRAREREHVLASLRATRP